MKKMICMILVTLLCIASFAACVADKTQDTEPSMPAQSVTTDPVEKEDQITEPEESVTATTELETEATTESATEPTGEPETESTTEPVTESTTEPAVESETQVQQTEPTTEAPAPDRGSSNELPEE